MFQENDPPEFLPLNLDASSQDTGELPAADVITQKELEQLSLDDAKVRVEGLRIRTRLERGAIVEPGPRRPSRSGLDQPGLPRVKFVAEGDSSLDVEADIRREQASMAAPPPAKRRNRPPVTTTEAGLKRKYWLQLLASVDIATPKGHKEILYFAGTIRSETRQILAVHRARMDRNRCYDIPDYLRVLAKLEREYWLLRGALLLHQFTPGDWRGCVADRGTRILALREMYLPA